MNTEVVEVPTSNPTWQAPAAGNQTLPSVVDSTNSLIELAIRSQGGVEMLERIIELQRGARAEAARNAYNTAFSAFKAEAVKIIKNRTVTDGPLKNKKYAELFAVVNAVTPALSRHGLSTAWKITQAERDWVEVTCTLSHVAGHSESVTMGGPADTGGAKNAIQARASTVTFLERYTLKAILGLAEQEDDDDGGASGGPVPVATDATVQKWIFAVAEAKDVAALQATWAQALADVQGRHDRKAYDMIKAEVNAKLAKLQEGPQ